MPMSNAERQRNFRQRRKAEREMLLSAVEELAARLAEVKPGIPPEALATLAAMPSEDLARWVKIGERQSRERAAYAWLQRFGWIPARTNPAEVVRSTLDWILGRNPSDKD